AEAKRLGALTIGISCTPQSELSRAVDIAIEPLPGPEIVAGSTRMKAGTATKLVLNMLTTGTFIRRGYVFGNLMVNVQPKNSKLRDIRTMERLLVDIGSKVEVDQDIVRIETPEITSPEAPYELVKTMRASSLVLGPLAARAGRARVSLPGGCAIGARPIDLHIAGLEHLGAQIRQSHGYVEADASTGLRVARVHFDRITVTGTEDLLMAATL